MRCLGLALLLSITVLTLLWTLAYIYSVLLGNRLVGTF